MQLQEPITNRNLCLLILVLVYLNVNTVHASEAFIKSSDPLPFCNSTGACTTIINTLAQFSLTDNYISVRDEVGNRTIKIELQNMKLTMQATSGNTEYFTFDHSFRDAMSGCRCCVAGACPDPEPFMCGTGSTQIDMSKYKDSNIIIPFTKITVPGNVPSNQCTHVRTGDSIRWFGSLTGWFASKLESSNLQALADKVDSGAAALDVSPDAHCCYLLMADTTEIFYVYSTLTYRPSSINVTYNGVEYTIGEGSTAFADDINITYLETPNSGVLDNRYSLLVAPNASVYMVETKLLNNPDGGDPTRYGWWNQDNKTVQELIGAKAQFPDPNTIKTNGGPGSWTRKVRVQQLSNWLKTPNGVPKVNVTINFNPSLTSSFYPISSATITAKLPNGDSQMISYSSTSPFTVFLADVSAFYQRASSPPTFVVCMKGLVICGCNRFNPGDTDPGNTFKVDQDCNSNIIMVTAGIIGSNSKSAIIYGPKKLLYTSIYEAIIGFKYSTLPTAPVTMAIRSDKLLPYVQQQVSCALGGGGFSVTATTKILSVEANADNCGCVFVGDVSGTTRNQVMFKKPMNITMPINDTNVFASCGQVKQQFSINVAVLQNGQATQPVNISTDLSRTSKNSEAGSASISARSGGFGYWLSTFGSAISKFFGSIGSFIGGIFSSLKTWIFIIIIGFIVILIISIYVSTLGEKTILSNCCCCVRRRKVSKKIAEKLRAFEMTALGRPNPEQPSNESMSPNPSSSSSTITTNTVDGTTVANTTPIVQSNEQAQPQTDRKTKPYEARSDEASEEVENRYEKRPKKQKQQPVPALAQPQTTTTTTTIRAAAGTTTSKNDDNPAGAAAAVSRAAVEKKAAYNTDPLDTTSKKKQ